MDEFEVSLTQEEINAVVGALDVTGEEEEDMLQRVAQEIGTGAEEASVVLETLFKKVYELYEHPDTFAGADRDIVQPLSFDETEA